MSLVARDIFNYQTLEKLLESFVVIAMNYFIETDASMFLNKKDEKYYEIVNVFPLCDDLHTCLKKITDQNCNMQ